MDKYYTAIMVISVFTLLIMEVCAWISGNLTREKKKQFTLLFVTTAIALACEYLGNVLQETDICLRGIHIVVKAVELSIAPFIGVIMAGILKKSNHQKVILIILCAHVLLEFLSGKLGFIYVVSDENVYYHAEYYWIYIAFYLLSTVYALCVIFSTMKNYQYNGATFLVMLAVLVVLGISIQLYDGSVKVVWLTMTITGILLYIFNSEMVQQTDALTLLINRRGYEVFLSHMQTPAVILFFDVDRFKDVNDTYGHAYGDICLRNIGELLRGIYARYGKCFRIGGDEFCVVLTKKPEQFEKLNSNLLYKLEDLRGADRRVPSVSIGYAQFHPDAECVQDAVNRADEMMYRYKQAHRS